MNLQDYMKSLNPESEILFYGSKYHCWRDDEYIGVFTWTKDDNVGDSFQQETEKGNLVAIPTRFELITTQ